MAKSNERFEEDDHVHLLVTFPPKVAISTYPLSDNMFRARDLNDALYPLPEGRR